MTIEISSCSERTSKSQFDEFVDKALRLEKKGDYKGALISIQEAIKIVPNKSNLYVFRGKLSYFMGDDKNALSDYSIAIEINPKNTSALFYKALSYSYLKMEDSAVHYFNKAIQSKTTEEGIIFEHQYNEYTALENRVNVETSVLRYNRGVSLYELERDDDALNDFQFSLLSGYKEAECYSYLGIILLSKGDLEKGCEMLKNGVSLKDSIATSYYYKYCISNSTLE